MLYRILIILLAGVCLSMPSAHGSDCKVPATERDPPAKLKSIAELEINANSLIDGYYAKAKRLDETISWFAERISSYPENEESITKLHLNYFKDDLVRDCENVGDALYALEKYIRVDTATLDGLDGVDDLKRKYLYKYDYNMGLISHEETEEQAGIRFIDQQSRLYSLLDIMEQRTVDHKMKDIINDILEQLESDVFDVYTDKFHKRAVQRGEESRVYGGPTLLTLEEILSAYPGE